MKRLFFTLGFIFCLGLLFTSCEKQPKADLTVAATSVPHAEILEHVKSLLQDKGFEMAILVVEDYNTPNRALQDKEVEANFFQHLPFLQAQQADFGYRLESLAGVHIEPMGLYSTKISQLADLKPKSVIAIPNDPSNQARALLLLEKQGFIKLKQKNVNTSVLDILEGPYQFLEIEPALLSRTLEDVDLAAITTNFALQANLSPQKDALALEDGESLFTNLLVIREGEKDNPSLQALKECLTSSSTKLFIEEKYKGAVIPAF